MRRSRPAVALVLAMGGLYAVMATVEIYQTVPFPSMVAGYSLALASSRRITILAGLALVPFVVAAIALFGHGPPVRDTRKFVDFCAGLPD